MHARRLCFVLLLLCAATAHALKVGDAMPGLDLPRADGSALRAAELDGKVVLVDFWASWCAPCRKSFPFLGELQARYGGEGFTVVGINVDEERSEADRFLAETPAAFPIVFDPAGETPADFGVKGMPSSYLIDRAGKVILVHKGFRERDKAELEAKVKEALAAGSES
jgi:thiol-disulfide isomerase/thioredoxin